MDEEDKASEPNWDGILRREIAIECRSVDPETRSVEVVASTEALDSHGDIVKQHWDLSRYKKNGPVLWNHNRFEAGFFGGGAVSPKDLLPIGKGSNTRVESGELVSTLTFGSKAYNELSESIFLGFQEGMIKAVSVGFRPGQVTRVLNEDGSTKHFEVGSQKNPNQLIEISVVPMGSNPEAVAKSLAFERRHLETLAEPNTDPGRPTATPALGGKESKRMDPELQKAIEAKTLAEKALSDEKTARENAEKATATERTRAEKAEGELKAEKAVSEKLTADLAKANETVAKANGELAKAALDALQGVKFAPAERPELDKLVAEVGLDRVKGILAPRPDIALTQPVVVENKKVSDGEPAPVVAAPDTVILQLANKAISN